MMETIQGTKTGFWPAGSWLDRLDTSLSTPIFTLTLPPPVEYLLTTGGMWFGVPLISLFLGSLMLGAAVSPALLQSRALPPSFLVVAWWVWLVAESKRDSSSSSSSSKKADGDCRGLLRAYHPGGGSTLPELAFFMAAPQLALLLINKGAEESSPSSSSSSSSSTAAAAAAAGFHACAWFLTQLIIEVAKSAAARERPAVRLHQGLLSGGSGGGGGDKKGQEVRTPPRALPQIQELLRSSGTARASFPSGDAAGAMVFAVVGRALSSPSSSGPSAAAWWWFVCPAMSAFGRMFFHAHHLLDVTCGLAVGWFVATALLQAAQQSEQSEQSASESLDQQGTPEPFGRHPFSLPLSSYGRPVVVAGAQAAFVVSYLAIQKIKKALQNGTEQKATKKAKTG